MGWLSVKIALPNAIAAASTKPEIVIVPEEKDYV
jgi:hypothetical protein